MPKLSTPLLPEPGAALAARYAALHAIASGVTRLAAQIADQVPPLLFGDDLFSTAEQEHLLVGVLSSEVVQTVIKAKALALRPGVADVTRMPPSTPGRAGTSVRTVTSRPVTTPRTSTSPSGRYAPLTPTGMLIRDQSGPYQPPAFTRVTLTYSTPTQVRVRDGATDASHPQHAVYPIADDATWDHVVQCDQVLRATLGALAAKLRAIGSYRSRLEQVGGQQHHKDVLSPTVIRISDPDGRGTSWSTRWTVPPLSRATLHRHTARCIVLQANATPVGNADTFVCPDDDTWAAVAALHAAAVTASAERDAVIAALGTYDQAIAGNRYGALRPSTPAHVPPHDPPPMFALLGV